ncbi:hypothetical protein MKK64_17480 [Methylobacterium sp. E-025]|uniref:hypothetical protein n=1 Tax=Methylobacterium sp. E-025 TaxID=2836561 RepID=UPI001FB874EA|nr:hypothetical protein [Methylobacterium sp. E-025]MCJ2112975.1 hypothetical protein [Methylobacterium sp. E-025]
MSARNWSTNPDDNAFADPGIPVQDGASARTFTGSARGIMAGVALALEGIPVLGHTPVFDQNYVAQTTDTQIGFANLTVPRTVTLPDVDSYPLGQVLFIADESGQCSVDRPITIAAGVGTGDSIAGQPAIQLTDAYQGLGFRRGAANVWIIAR